MTDSEHFAIALYIKVENGYPVEPPSMPDNLMMAFGKIPDNYEPFMRFSEEHRTPLDVFEVWDKNAPEYAKVNGIWTDTYARRPMTAEERAVEENLILEGLRECQAEMLADAKAKLPTETHPVAISRLQEYIAKMEALELTWDNRLELHPPTPTLFDKNGNLIDVMNSGSAPDVIG
jgi:hypothetical protein